MLIKELLNYVDAHIIVKEEVNIILFDLDVLLFVFHTNQYAAWAVHYFLFLSFKVFGRLLKNWEILCDFRKVLTQMVIQIKDQK